MNILIQGASVAGPALGALLADQGYSVTIVERAPALRAGGQAIDVRGVALDVAAKLGIREDLERLRTRMRGMSMLDASGKELFRTEEMTITAGRFDSGDVEVMRDDLTALLYARTKDRVDYRFGETLTSLDEEGNVTFERGAPRRFDLVVGADGLHSRTRRFVFGDESQFVHSLGIAFAIFSMPNFFGLDGWQIWLRGEASGFGIFPVPGNKELRVNVQFGVPPVFPRELALQKAAVAEALAPLGWETPCILDALREAKDLYFDEVAQVRMPSWSRGRVVLLGDAAFCPSPSSGQGTSLALVGAHVLAQALARDDLASYETRMRPFVEMNQALALENPGGPAALESIERAKNAITL